MQMILFDFFFHLNFHFHLNVNVRFWFSLVISLIEVKNSETYDKIIGSALNDYPRYKTDTEKLKKSLLTKKQEQKS